MDSSRSSLDRGNATPDPAATTVLLVRHGHTDAVGRRLVGRLPGVALTTEGRAQAARLARRLDKYAIRAIYASPLQRAIETAEPLASELGLAVQLHDDLIEIDFGDWTGRTFAELEDDPAWHTFNARRGTAVVPRGERATTVQARITRAMESLARAHPGETIAAISHADVIRAAVLHYARIPLHDFHRIEISPASVTAIQLGSRSARFLAINEKD